MSYKYNRMENTIKGTISGLALQAFNILAPFILRTVFIYTLGIEYTGLNSLFTSIISVLNLAELGVGTALVFSMYKPISSGDTDKICALMQLYKVYYRIIGIFVLTIGILITPILPHLINGTYPDGINLYIIYYLNLSATVLSYWLFAYKISIISAHQKYYIINNVSLAISISQFAFLFLVLVIWKNYYVYLVIILFFQILKNIVTAIYSTKAFPQYQARGKICASERHEINVKVLQLFAAKVCGVVTNSADSIVLSSFLGLTILGIYNNYYYILTSVMATFAVFYNAIRAGIGNSLISETPEKNAADFNKMTFLLSFLICVSFSCFLNVYQPFISVWLGTERMLGFSSVVLLAFYFLSYEYPIFWAIYKDAAGKWKEDLLRSIIAPIFNLTVNILLVKNIGINGVILSTVITYAVISGPWLLYNLRKHILVFNMKQYLFKLGMYIGCTIGCGFLSWVLCGLVHVGGVTKVIYNLSVSMIVPASVFFMVFRKTHDGRAGFTLIIHIIKNKIGRKS